MTTPTTPAECRAEQERVLKLLEGTTPGKWRVGSPLFRCKMDHGKGSGGHGEGECRYTFDSWHNWGHAVEVDPGYTPESVRRDEETLVAGMWDHEDGGIRRPEDAQFIAAAPTLARSHAAILAAHAEALERERWIPTDERLPDEGQRVLFVNIAGQVLSGRRHADGWDEPLEFWSHEEVTYWQALPAPPAPASAGGAK